MSLLVKEVMVIGRLVNSVERRAGSGARTMASGPLVARVAGQSALHKMKKRNHITFYANNMKS